MALTNPLIAALTALGLLVAGGAAAFAPDFGAPEEKTGDCPASADEWECRQKRIEEACREGSSKDPTTGTDHKRDPREPSKECREAYEREVADYCRQHPEDWRCEELACRSHRGEGTSAGGCPAPCEEDDADPSDRPKGCATPASARPTARPPVRVTQLVG